MLLHHTRLRLLSTRWISSSSSSRAPLSTIASSSSTDVSSKTLLNPLPDFSNASAAYETSTLPDLCRAWISLSLCQWSTLVQHAPTLHQWSRQWLGDTWTDWALRQTFFGHFCGGVDAAAMAPKIARLEAAGVGSILDYAAEDESPNSTTTTTDAVARVYTYETEQECDRHLATFEQCVRAVQTLGKDGFAAVKVCLV